MSKLDPNEVDRELMSLSKTIDGLRQRLRLRQLKNSEMALHELDERLKQLGQESDVFARDTSTALSDLRAIANESLDQLSDLSKVVSATSHRLSQQTPRSSQATDGKREAAKALVAAHDQLATAAATDSLHRDVLEGQRDNIRLTILQLGFIDIIPAHASRFDPSRSRSGATTLYTSDVAQHDRVARVEQVGWEASDGTGMLRLPTVTLYEYSPEVPAPGSETDALATEMHHNLSEAAILPIEESVPLEESALNADTSIVESNDRPVNDMDS